MTSSMRAASATERVMGPASSCVVLMGRMPLRLTRPRVGRMPTKLAADAGDRIDWPVSLPVPRMPKLAAMAAAVPPLDPPGVRSTSYGLRVWPPKELMVVPPMASSVRLALARMRAPALRSCWTTKQSC